MKSENRSLGPTGIAAEARVDRGSPGSEPGKSVVHAEIPPKLKATPTTNGKKFFITFPGPFSIRPCGCYAVPLRTDQFLAVIRGLVVKLDSAAIPSLLLRRTSGRVNRAK